MPDSSSVSSLDLSPVVVIETETIACPLCDRASFQIVVTAEDPQWGIPGTFQVVACKSCRHRYMNPAPTASSLSDCYPLNYGPHQNRPVVGQSDSEFSAEGTSSAIIAPKRPWYLKWLPLKKIPGLRRFLFWLLDDRSQVFPDAVIAATDDPTTGEATSSVNSDCLNASHQSMSTAKAFELGCAAGAYLQKIQATGWDVQGLEPSVEAAKTAVQAGLEVDQGTLNDHSYPSDTYQWIALWMVLEHVPDPRATLTELYRMLTEEGTLALSVPNAGCWEPLVFGRHWDAWDLPRHLHHFRPSTVRRLLEECGYTDVRIQHQRSLLNVVGSVGVWLTSVFPGSRMGAWFRSYPHQPRLWFQLLMAPLAQLLGMIGQGGRLTVTATKATNQTAEATRAYEHSGPVSQRQMDA